MITQRNPAAANMLEEWNFFRQSYVGGRHYINGDNLFSHAREKAKDFKNRLQRAYYLNYVAPGIDLYSGFIFNARISRQANGANAKTLDAYWNNVDGSDKKMGAFAKRAMIWAQVYGWVGVLTDKARPKEEVLSRVEEGQIYSYLIFPDAVLDWDLDQAGDLVWVTIEEKYPLVRAAGVEIPEELPRRVRLWTRTEWELYEVTKNSKGKLVSNVVDAGEHALGKVPLDILRNRDLDENAGPALFGQSAISDIAYVNRYVFNLCSLLDEMFYEQIFHLLAVPDNMELSDRKISVHELFTFPHDSQHVPFYLAPEVAQAQLLVDQVHVSIKLIRQMFGLGGRESEDSKAARSGEAWAWEHLDKDQLIADKAANAEAWEQKVADTVARWDGAEGFNGSIDYPDTYDVEVLEDEIDTAFRALNMQLGEKFDRWVRGRIARKYMKSATEEERAEVLKDIKEAPVPPPPIIGMRNA